MNSKPAPRKVSKMMQMMNYLLYTVFAFQMTIICLYSALFLSWMNNNEDVLQYLNMESKSGSVAWKFIIQVCTYWVAYS